MPRGIQSNRYSVKYHKLFYRMNLITHLCRPLNSSFQRYQVLYDLFMYLCYYVSLLALFTYVCYLFYNFLSVTHIRYFSHIIPINFFSSVYKTMLEKYLPGTLSYSSSVILLFLERWSTVCTRCKI